MRTLVWVAISLFFPLFIGDSSATLDNESVRSTTFAKLVALLPVRDEAEFLPACLKSISQLVHAIVVLDDCSTDGTGQVARNLAVDFKVERIERSPHCLDNSDGAAALPYWGDETSHRGYLLQLGRSIGGTHFIAIDADEMVVIGDCHAHDYRELRKAMLQMQEGDLFVMKYITMWGSATTMRTDKADTKAIAFADQPDAFYGRRSHDDRLHTPRLPSMPRPGRVWEIRPADPAAGAGAGAGAAVLHLGFADLARARLKNVLYNLFDAVSGTGKTAAEMNRGLADQGLTPAAARHAAAAGAPLRPAWAAAAAACGMDAAVEGLRRRGVPRGGAGGWRQAQVLGWLCEGTGPARFAGLAALGLLAEDGVLDLPPALHVRTVRMLSRLQRARPGEA